MILRHLTMIMMTAMVDPEVKDDHDKVCLEANLLHIFFVALAIHCLIVGEVYANPPSQPQKQLGS